MQSQGYFCRVHELTPTRYWVNNPTRAQTAEAILNGAVSCTTNPTYIQKVCQDPVERDYVTQLIMSMIRDEDNDNTVVEKLQTKLVSNIAELFKPVFDSSNGSSGYVSIQGDPFDESAENIISYGMENATVAPNIIPKIPVTPSGLKAIGELIQHGIIMLATEVMSVQQFIDIAELYDAAGRTANIQPLIFAHIAGIFDDYLHDYVKEHSIDILPDVLWQAGISIMKKIERIKAEHGYRILSLSGGARGLHHFTEMVGARSGVTINWSTTSEELLESNPLIIERFAAATPDIVVNELREKIPVFRKAYDENGLSSEEYEEYGPVAMFRTQFEHGWVEARNLVAKCRAGQA